MTPSGDITTTQGCMREILIYKEIDLLYIPNFLAGIPAWSLSLNGGLTIYIQMENYIEKSHNNYQYYIIYLIFFFIILIFLIFNLMNNDSNMVNSIFKKIRVVKKYVCFLKIKQLAIVAAPYRDIHHSGKTTQGCLVDGIFVKVTKNQD